MSCEFYLSKKVVYAGKTVEPGEKTNGVVCVPDLFADGQPLELPFLVYNGAEKGPTLYVQVAQHPAETWGIEGVYNVLHSLDPSVLSGMVVFSLPNPVGFRFASYYPPHLTHDINRVGYGKPDGSLMERIVYAWWINFVKGKADYVVDIHGVPPASFVYYEAHGVSPGIPLDVAEKSERLALLFSCDFNMKQMEPYGGGTSFRGACVDHGIPAIVPEIAIGGANVTERGLRNIMVDLGMIDGRIELPEKQYTLKYIEDRSASAIRNSVAGCFKPSVKIGDLVSEGDEVGIIYSPRTFEVVETLVAHRDGFVSSLRDYPVKVVGETVLSIHEVLEVVENK